MDLAEDPVAVASGVVRADRWGEDRADRLAVPRMVTLVVDLGGDHRDRRTDRGGGDGDARTMAVSRLAVGAVCR